MSTAIMARKATSGHKPKAKRLTQSEVGVLLQLHKDGKTQTEIAQLLGITQGAVSRWLQNTTDTTNIAKSYLRGSALRMAQNIVHKGLAKDHVVALKGLGVLEEQQSQGVTVIVGGSAEVQIGILQPQQVVVVQESHSAKLDSQ